MRSSFCLLFLLVSVVGFSQGTPKPNTDRRAILEALRDPVEKDLKQKVIFKVNHLKVHDNWAFLTGQSLTPGGKKIDYRKTKYKDAVNSDAFDDWICALLQKKGKTWRVVQFAIGATDVVWDGWHLKYKAPKAIFPYGN